MEPKATPSSRGQQIYPMDACAQVRRLIRLTRMETLNDFEHPQRVLPHEETDWIDSFLHLQDYYRNRPVPLEDIAEIVQFFIEAEQLFHEIGGKLKSRGIYVQYFQSWQQGREAWLDWCYKKVDCKITITSWSKDSFDIEFRSRFGGKDIHVETFSSIDDLRQNYLRLFEAVYEQGVVSPRNYCPTCTAS